MSFSYHGYTPDQLKAMREVLEATVETHIAYTNDALGWDPARLMLGLLDAHEGKTVPWSEVRRRLGEKVKGDE